jgi:hypothetical protein
MRTKRGDVMRGGIVAVGVLILIVGVILAFYGYSGLQEYGKLGIWGPILQALSEDARRAVEQLRMITISGIILGIIGFFATIAGFIVKPKTEK